MNGQANLAVISRNGIVQVVTYRDKFRGYSDISFSKNPPCACGKDETKTSGEENEHEDDVHTRCAYHIQHVQAGTCDEEEACDYSALDLVTLTRLIEEALPKLALNSGVSEPIAGSIPLVEYAPAAL